MITTELRHTQVETLSRRHELSPGLSPFPQIADYAFLSDCNTTALVAPSGNVEWLCLPRMDSPSVFGAILDRDAGGFRLGPADAMVPAARRYLPGTMVVETSWVVKGGGWLIVRDALLIGPWHHENERSDAHRRTPTDYEAEHVLLRTIRCVNGEVQVVADCHPMFNYGVDHAVWEYAGDDYHEVQAADPASGVRLRLISDLRLGVQGGRATARHLMREGETAFCALSWNHHEPPRTYEDAYARQVWTAHHWQRWLDQGDFPDHPWREHLQRSALTLKGLSHQPTGALAAAATTSLPETPGGERNWDYRYSWMRDSTFALWAFNTLGFEWEAADFFAFLTDIAGQGEDLQIMYGIGRTTGTLERLMTMPMAKFDLLAGYAIAFGAVAALQAGLVSAVGFVFLDLDAGHSVALVIALAIANGLVGMSLGLFVSAFAKSEFQAVQFMPAFLLPQILLCGLFTPRDEMAPALETVSDFLPITYAFDGLARAASPAPLGSEFALDLVVVVGTIVLALALGAATLRRRTP